MSIWQRLLNLIGKHPKPTAGHRIYQVSGSLQILISSVAQREGLPEDEFLDDLVAAGLVQHLGIADFAPKWKSLSKREKEVASLVRRGLTNRQIAGQLSISTETANTHVQNIMRKFGLNDKAELRHILALINFAD
ncbi:MAG: helix-turn-helix transcriptional regulator [Anaerolineales bacterium]